MMLEVGQIFKKNGYEYCLIDFLMYEGKKYALFSLELDKVAYIFYEVIETNDGYDLIKVNDDKLNYKLLELFEKKEEE